MSIRTGLGKVKNHKPETFVFVSMDMDRGVIKNTTFFREPELRAWLVENLKDLAMIDSVIEEARQTEV